MTKNENADELTKAVLSLTRAVTSLDKLLRDDYPKRAEIERRFVSKIQSRRLISQMLVVALVVVGVTFSGTIGVYAACFTGSSNPDLCKIAPGYQDRIDRRDEINEVDRKLERRIRQLEREDGRSR